MKKHYETKLLSYKLNRTFYAMIMTQKCHIFNMICHNYGMKLINVIILYDLFSYAASVKIDLGDGIKLLLSNFS